MNKRQKRLVSALAAATSVAAVIAPVATVFAATKDDAQALVDNAKKTMAFVDYNQAYAAIMALPAADQPALLAQLAPLWDKVATKDVTDVLNKMDALAANKDLKNYYDLYDMINNTVSLPRNQQYLMGELTSWGKNAVFTSDVVAATDAIIKAWTSKSAADIQAAKDASAKVTNAGSLAWLNDQIAQVSAAAPVAVSSVTASSASTFTVKFSNPVADTSKVAFTVTNSSTPVTVTTTWNADKTAATLTNSVNFPEGTYTVAVKNDTTDLGSSTVAVTAQKVAKIEITSNKLAINANRQTGDDYIGYATYKVSDQYGNDITTTYLANNLTFQAGVGTATAKDGTLKVDFGQTNPAQYTVDSITAYDSTSGVSTSASLSCATSFGTLNSITLNKLTNVNNKDLTANDQSDVWYIDYSATDANDNATQDYNMVLGGLITNNGYLVVSNNYVTAQVVTDPNDSSKAAIEVRTTQPITMDLPVTITAMTYTGKTSTLNLTLHKQASLDTLTLQAPNYSIATGESKEIPFVAYDQNGVQLTKYDDIMVNNLNLSPRLTPSRNSDGTLKLTYNAPNVKGPDVLTATTPTGKFSSLTINVQDAAKADKLVVDSSIVKNLQESYIDPATNSTMTAISILDFGYDNGGLTLNDQYGRKIDMWGGNNNYAVVATSSDDKIVTFQNGNNVAMNGQHEIIMQSGDVGKAGSATITLNVYDLSQKDSSGNALYTTPGDYSKLTKVDTQSITMTTVDNGDIKGYTMDTRTAPIFAQNDLLNSTVYDINNKAGLTDKQKDLNFNPVVYGTTAGGGKVILGSDYATSKARPIVGAYLSNTTNFKVVGDAIENAAGAQYDGLKVVANKLADTVTTSSTTLTAAIKAYDGSIKTVTTTVNSSSALPAVSTIAINNDESYGGVYVDGDTINVKIDATTFNNNNLNIGGTLTRYDQQTGMGGARVPFYIYGLDQYGKKDSNLSFTVVPSQSTVNLTNGFNIDSNGKITVSNTANITDGQYITINAVSNNGLVKTFKIVFKNNQFN